MGGLQAQSARVEGHISDLVVSERDGGRPEGEEQELDSKATL